VRNRDRWNVIDVEADGRVTVSHMGGHGRVTLTADYVTAHVRLGYAATAHGHQWDTVDVGIVLVTAATNHRSLYVGATRGRQENRLLVVTDETQEASEVLEQVLTNDRADTPAVAQRRHMAAQLPGSTGGGDARSAEGKLVAAPRALDDVKRRTGPFLQPLHEADSDVRTAEDVLRTCRTALVSAPAWRRRRPAVSVAHASEVLADATGRRDAAEQAAAPYLAEVHVAEAHVEQAECAATTCRVQDLLDSLSLTAQARGIGRGIGV
jgi:hypothetical protein